MKLNKKQEILVWVAGLLLAIAVPLVISNTNYYSKYYAPRLLAGLVQVTFPIIVIAGLFFWSLRTKANAPRRADNESVRTAPEVNVSTKSNGTSIAGWEWLLWVLWLLAITVELAKWTLRIVGAASIGKLSQLFVFLTAQATPSLLILALFLYRLKLSRRAPKFNFIRPRLLVAVPYTMLLAVLIYVFFFSPHWSYNLPDRASVRPNSVSDEQIADTTLKPRHDWNTLESDKK